VLRFRGFGWVRQGKIEYLQAVGLTGKEYLSWIEKELEQSSISLAAVV
jgi:hypothetical protein